MGQRILGLIVLILILVGAYYTWQHYYGPQRQVANGAVHWENGQPTKEEKDRFARENAGETPDGQLEHKDETASESAAEIAAGGTGYNGPDGRSLESRRETTQDPWPRGEATRQALPTGSYALTNGGTPAGGPLPAYDTQRRNAPDGMRFGGSGAYVLYRQGDLTYRVDTVTGSSCIAFATMEEWRKPIVYSHGCGRY
jgi:hypothetical protein